jgi:serine/threonine-protein kinase
MIGETIGRYELRSRLGEGPFGEVWLAGHRETQAAVAIKLLHADVSSLPAIARFVDDARAVGRLANAGIAKVFDAGLRPDGRAYAVSELVLGQTLRQRISAGRFSQTQVADVVAQTARALAAAQGVNVSHHDLKPTNILLVPDEERATGERVVVLDFGLAPLATALLAPSAIAIRAATPYLAAGAPYLAPEQWRAGEAPVSPAADIYALGCLAFEMATGRPPFKAPSHATLRERHLQDQAPSVRSYMPDIGAVMDKLVGRMLEKSPTERPRSMKDIAKLFDLLVGHQAPLGETVTD